MGCVRFVVAEETGKRNFVRVGNGIGISRTSESVQGLVAKTVDANMASLWGRAYRYSSLEVKKLDRHIRQIFPTTEVQDGKDFGFFSAAYVDSRYKANYVVEPEVMDKLTGWVEAFQHWVYKECLKAIDEFVPEENFSNGYKLHFPLMDFEDLKVRPLVEDLLIEEKIEKDQALREKELERQAKDRALEREGQALKEKDQALKEKEQAHEEKEFERLEKEKALKEIEALRRKLKEAGLDDDGK
ncbi:MAG: hypothetical protein JKY24_06160 [Pseudomonadales bacterium]|nr:hypothetical protein [Pseudomonadales bacterium]